MHLGLLGQHAGSCNRRERESPPTRVCCGPVQGRSGSDPSTSTRRGNISDAAGRAAWPVPWQDGCRDDRFPGRMPGPEPRPALPSRSAAPARPASGRQHLAVGQSASSNARQPAADPGHNRASEHGTEQTTPPDLIHTGDPIHRGLLVIHGSTAISCRQSPLTNDDDGDAVLRSPPQAPIRDGVHG